MVLMGTPVHYSSSSGGGDMRINSIVLDVPYSHRHVAMALGAMWDPCRRVWWAPNEPHWNFVLSQFRPRRPNSVEIARGNAPLGDFVSTAPVSLSSSPDPSEPCADRPPPPPVADGVAQREIRQYFPLSVANPGPPRRPPPPPSLASAPTDPHADPHRSHVHSDSRAADATARAATCACIPSGHYGLQARRGRMHLRGRQLLFGAMLHLPRGVVVHRLLRSAVRMCGGGRPTPR